MSASQQRSTVRIGVALLVLMAAAGPILGRTAEVSASCEPHPPATDLLDAVAIVDGAVVDERPGDRGRPIWTFRVDERFRGATPDMIEIESTGSTNWSNRPPDGVLAFYVETAPHRFEWTTECRYQEVGREVIERVTGAGADAGGGVPHAIVAMDSPDHSLAVVDSNGAVLRHLATSGPTLGLGTCPGGRRFVQVRARSWVDTRESRQLELVSWSVESMAIESVAVVELDVDAGSATVSCRASDASEVLLTQWLTTVAVVNGVPGPGSQVGVDRPIELPATADRPDAGVQLVHDDGVNARLALTAGGEAFVETPTDAGVLEVFLQRSDGVTRSWHPYAVSSIQPHTDGGWWLTMDDGDRASVVLIRPDGTSLDTGRFVRTDVTAWWPIGILFDPTTDVELPPPSRARPAPLIERNGERVAPEPSTAPVSVPVTSDLPPGAAATTAWTTDPPEGADVADASSGAPADQRSNSVWIVSGVVVLCIAGVAVLALRRRSG